MSRISRYQSSVDSFIKKKANYFNEDIRQTILDISNDSEHVIGILLLTIMKNKCEEFNLGRNIHGYYACCAIETFLFYVIVCDDMKYYTNKYNDCNIFNKLIKNTQDAIYLFMLNNMNVANENYGGTQHKTYSKNIIDMSKLFGIDINNIMTAPSDLIKNANKYAYMTRTDVMKYKFENVNLLDKLKYIKIIDDATYDNYMENTYGTVCKLSIICGLIMGSDIDSAKNTNKMKKLGLNFAYMYKSVRDFVYLERDLELCEHDSFTTNMIVNKGFQNTFELFMTNKQKFIEGCIIHNIYTNTVKEMINLLEDKMDAVLENSSSDLYTAKTIISR